VTTSEHVWNEYLDEDALAERYLIPPRTAQRWRTSGGGPPFVRLGKRRVLYRVADVEAWLAARTYASRADELSRSPVAVPRPPPNSAYDPLHRACERPARRMVGLSDE
jgi:hypothetical protein